jgi:hypothetical protein
MYLFLSVIVWMSHDQGDRLKICCPTLQQFFVAFYGNIVEQDRFLNLQRFLHFSGNRNEPEKTGENYDMLWKMRTIYDKISDAYAKYCSPTDHLAVNENIVVSFSNSIYHRNTNDLG